MYKPLQRRRPTSRTQPTQRLEDSTSRVPVQETPTAQTLPTDKVDQRAGQPAAKGPEIPQAQPYQFTVLPPGAPPPPENGPVTIRPSLPDFRHGNAVPVQRQEDLAARIQAQRGKGAPLSLDVQRQLEQGLGASLSRVRVNTDSTADALARSVQAVAFTTGSNIFFRHGAYNPDTPEGIHLLAHEATHTVQQSSGPVDGTPHPGGISISDPSDRFERSASESAARVSDGLTVQPARMQRGAGAEGALSIQRMPTSAEVEAQAGARKGTTKKVVRKGWKLKTVQVEMGSHYKLVLGTLDHYHGVIAQPIAPADVQFGAQVQSIQRTLNEIIQRCDDYIRLDRRNEIEGRCRTLKKEAELEQIAVANRIHYLQNNPGARQGTWKDVLPQGMATRVVDIGAEGGTAGGTAAGALNKVTKVTLASGYTGYFKADKPWAGYSPDDEGPRTEAEWNKAVDALAQEYADVYGSGTPEEQAVKAAYDAAKAAQGEVGLSGEIGIEATNPHFGDRNVAAYRVDQLFGAGVIPRTESAEMGGMRGTLMEAARGEELKSVATTESRLFHSASARTKAGPGPKVGVHADDPGLQRWLSRLNLIDAIIGQIDRHLGNIFIQVDSTGSVTGITGIDNDLTFPTKKFAIHKNVGAYSGLPAYADKELAARILATSDADLTAVVADLLTDEEITALIQRFHDVKQYLGTIPQLDPNEWTEKTAGHEEKQKTGYFGPLKRGARK
jgi:hypothetical protein